MNACIRILQHCFILHMEPHLNYIPESLLYTCPLYKTSVCAGVLSITDKHGIFAFDSCLLHFNNLNLKSWETVKSIPS